MGRPTATDHRGPPRRITADGKPVRLEGFHSQDHDVLHVTGSDGSRLSLLVIPADAAHDAMLVASGRGNHTAPADILAAGGIAPDIGGRRPVRPAVPSATDGGQVDAHG